MLFYYCHINLFNIITFLKQVWGWTRVAPLSCLFVTKKNHRKPKHKEVENPSPLCVDSMGPKADSSASIAEQDRESHIGQQIDSWGPTEWPVLKVMQEDVTHFLFKEQTVERSFKITTLRPCHLSSQHSVPENRHTEPQKHSHKSNDKLPFLPPIHPPQIGLKGSFHVCRSKKALDGENLERKSAARRAGVDIVANQNPSIHSAALTPKYHACQHNPHLFPAVSVSFPKKNQLLMSLPYTVHPATSYSMDKSISQAVVQPHMRPRCLFS